MRGLLVFGALSLALAIHSTSHAQQTDASKDEEARIHFALGKKYFDTGRFADALKEFEQAQELSGNTKLHYNIYLAAEKSGNFDRAVTALEAYLPTIPEHAADERAKVENQLRSTRRTRDLIARSQSGQAQAAEPDSAGSEQDTSQTDASTQPDAGSAATAETQSSTAATPVNEGSTNIWPWLTFGVGAAALVGSVITGFVAGGMHGDYDASCMAGVCDDAIKSSGETMVLLTDILLFSGAAIAAAGLIWVLVDGGSDDEAPATTSVALSPQLSTQFAGVSLSGSFQ